MSQIQTVLVQGLLISKGEFTPENGKNKGVPTPYDKIHLKIQNMLSLLNDN